MFQNHDVIFITDFHQFEVNFMFVRVYMLYIKLDIF